MKSNLIIAFIVLGAMFFIFLNKRRRKWIILWVKVYYLNAKLFLMTDQFLSLRNSRQKLFDKIIDVQNNQV